MRTTDGRVLLVTGALTAVVLGVAPVAAQEPCEVAKLLASDGAADDVFGYAVSLSGDVAIVGAYDDDDNGFVSGAAYIFRWNGSSWMEEQKLTASDGADGDYFGVSVSVSGDVAIIGAGGDDDNGLNSGSAYVFRWNGSSWVEEQKLLASDGAEGDYFGSVSLNGDTAIVGAELGDGIGGNTGSAYVFRWNGSSWAEEQELFASDGAEDDRFGDSVSLSGDTVIVGAIWNEGNGVDSGSAYVFRWNGSAWVEEQKLTASDGWHDYEFGNSVSLSGDVAIIGADGDDDNGFGAGAAYVFRRNGSSWVEEQKLLASDGAEGDSFGISVSLSGDAAIVGASGDDDNGTNSGSAYVFRWNGSSWVEEQKLLASDGAADDFFGRVAVSGEVAIIGARGDDDNGTDSGAAYVFDLSGALCCPADVDGGGTVDVNDLLILLDAWGPCIDCPADCTGDGVVDVDDLLFVLGEWGPCG